MYYRFFYLMMLDVVPMTLLLIIMFHPRKGQQGEKSPLLVRVASPSSPLNTPQ
jgi:hypothetical protein